MKEETTTVTIRLPVSLKRLLDSVCEQNDITPTQVLRACVRDYVARNQQGDLLSSISKKPRK